ncbi:MAG: hypothetical protein VR64_03620 [Desulfatitalea sp. BRH_c12]|nr:MAG: hypothetical protein VR64_03620 [Desulfatitalea sp. BRH_c12]
MAGRIVLLIGVALALVACATLQKNSRISEFDDVILAYRRALLDADYTAVRHFLDPGVSKASDTPVNKLVKVVEFNPTNVDVAEDATKIEQDICLQYYLLNVPRVKTLQYRQVWHYNAEHRLWLLQTPLPNFDQQ